MADEKKVFKRKRWHGAFLKGLEQYGQISAACVVAEISRTSVYKELEHPEFKSMFVDSERAHRDTLLLKVTQMAMGGTGIPRSVSLQAAQFLLARADRRLLDADRAGGEGPQVDSESLTIQVSEGMAKRLWPLMQELYQAEQFEVESGAEHDKKKPN
jgi:hypothetical protein